VDLVQKFGEKAYIARCRSGLLRDLGTSLSPFAAWAILQGIETLSLRLERSCENTLALAQWLQQHERVAWVQYPGLEDHESHKPAQRLLRPGYYGAMLNFAVKAPGSDSKEGDEQAGLDVINRVKLASHLVNVGDCE
jgi:O-acetylhomoserine/O-acetylserine sulfhydrylase